MGKSKDFVHLIGIGGVGMSWIAEMLLKQGKSVTGSDMRTSDITKRLKDHGAIIHFNHDPSYVEGASLVVYTAAAPEDHVELVRARELGIPVLGRAQMMGKMMQDYKTSIAISGAHGKSTTTSMLSTILADSPLDPTLLVGAHLDVLGGNAKIGSGDVMVMEACEYKDSFLNFQPTIGVILNIDEDHLDYFENLDQIVESFTTFSKGIPKNGVLILNADDYNARKIMSHVDCKIITFGINQDAVVMAKNITFTEMGFPKFDLWFKDEKVMNCTLSMPGTHNIYNSLAAIAAALQIGVNEEVIRDRVSSFKTAGRRYDVLGSFKGAKIVDDYAHHPTEIKSTLNAARKIPHNRIVCIFQPHTYTRTRELMMDFATSFADADRVIITDIYAAREPDQGLVHAKDLVENIRNEGQTAEYIATFAEIEERLNELLEPGDLVFTMGAGDIFKLGHKIAE